MKHLILSLLVLLSLAAPAQKNCSIDDMFYAIAAVESNLQEDAVNGNCVGILQISPILVAEVNRLLGYEAFYLNDRWDIQGSYAMFKIIMRYKNPKNDLRVACQIWNPTAGDWYYQRVLKEYKKGVSK